MRREINPFCRRACRKKFVSPCEAKEPPLGDVSIEIGCDFWWIFLYKRPNSFGEYKRCRLQTIQHSWFCLLILFNKNKRANGAVQSSQLTFPTNDKEQKDETGARRWKLSCYMKKVKQLANKIDKNKTCGYNLLRNGCGWMRVLYNKAMRNSGGICDRRSE